MRRLSYLPALIIFVLWFLIDLYVLQGLHVLTTSWVHINQIRLNQFFWIISQAVVVMFIFGFYQLRSSEKFRKTFSFLSNLFLTLLASKLLFVMVMLLEDIYRVLISIFIHDPERSPLVAATALILSTIMVGAFVFGVTAGKYHYKVRKSKVVIPGLPEDFDGFTITQISDIHSGSLDSKDGVQKGIDIINEQRSDLFVFTGDLVNNLATEIDPWISFFQQIKAPYGKFSVLGNHDYGDYVSWNSAADKAANLRKLKDNHDRMGFELLLDQNVKISREGNSIYLIGIENWGVGFGQRGELDQALQGVPQNAVKVLLSHDPSHWDAEVKNHPSEIHLTLAGHTHGMQFGFEFLGIKWSPVKYRYPNWAGLYNHLDKYLYVNRGFGFLGFAGRIGIWPEIAVIELKKA